MSEEPSTPPPAHHPPGGSTPSAPGIRASDEDRERLIGELRDHAVAGRLSTDEFEERLQATYAARTTAELDELRHDLPAPTVDAAVSHRERRAHLTRRMLQETGGSFGLFIICTAVWITSGANGQFWPIWVLLLTILSLARTGWSLFGPAPDLDAVEARLDSKRQRQIAERRRHLDRHDRRSGR